MFERGRVLAKTSMSFQLTRSLKNLARLKHVAPGSLERLNLPEIDEFVVETVGIGRAPTQRSRPIPAPDGPGEHDKAAHHRKQKEDQKAGQEQAGTPPREADQVPRGVLREHHPEDEEQHADRGVE